MTNEIVAGASGEIAIDAGEQAFDTSDQQLRYWLGVQIVDLSGGVVANAGDYAERRINASGDKQGFSGLCHRAWDAMVRRNMAREYLRRRYTQEGCRKIMASGNLFAASGGSAQDHENSAQAVVERFMPSDDLLHQGETNRQLETTENGQRLAFSLRGLVRSFAEGSLTSDEMRQEHDWLLRDYGQKADSKKSDEPGRLLADNFLNAADCAKTYADYGVDPDRIEDALSFNEGFARVGVRTEPQFTRLDKAIDKVSAGRFGSAVNETTIATVTGLPLLVATLGTSEVSAIVASTGIFALSVATIAGAREHYDTTRIRSTHMRQMAQGAATSSVHGRRRREAIAATRYVTENAKDLGHNLENFAQSAAFKSVKLQSLTKAIGHAEALIGLSDERRIDLIRYSSREAVEIERFDLDAKLAEAKLAFGKLLQNSHDTILQNAGMTTDRDEQAVINQSVAAERAIIAEQVELKDRAFNKLRRWQTAKTLAFAAVTSMGVGEFF